MFVKVAGICSKRQSNVELGCRLILLHSLWFLFFVFRNSCYLSIIANCLRFRGLILLLNTVVCQGWWYQRLYFFRLKRFLRVWTSLLQLKSFALVFLRFNWLDWHGFLETNDFRVCSLLVIGELSVAIVEALNGVAPEDGPLLRLSKEGYTDFFDELLLINVEQKLDFIDKYSLRLATIYVDEIARCTPDQSFCFETSQFLGFGLTISVVILVSIEAQQNCRCHLIQIKYHRFSFRFSL